MPSFFSKNTGNDSESNTINLKIAMQKMDQKIDLIFGKLPLNFNILASKKFFLQTYKELLQKKYLHNQTTLERYCANEKYEIILNKHEENITSMPHMDMDVFKKYRIVYTLDKPKNIIIMQSIENFKGLEEMFLIINILKNRAIGVTASRDPGFLTSEQEVI